MGVAAAELGQDLLLDLIGKGHAHGVGLYLIQYAVPYAQKSETVCSVTGKFFPSYVHDACHKGEFVHGNAL